MNVVIARTSKDTSFLMPASEASNVEGHSTELVDIESNIKPLPVVYNEVLKELRCRREQLDWIVFMHADVSIDIVQFLDDLRDFGHNYDAIGLCGTATISVKETPLNWFTGSRQFPKSRWGCVTHGENGFGTSFFSSHSPNEKHHSVACIDGLCIAISKTLICSDFVFDERFSFDCYDTDFSFECVIKRKLRLGVLVEKSLKHYSVGKSILGEKFLESEDMLREKWNLGFPEGSKVEKIHLTSASLQ